MSLHAFASSFASSFTPLLPAGSHAGLHTASFAVRLTAYALALALTLVLAAWCTPRHWWRRPTARGAAVLAAGTLAFGTLFLALAGRPAPALAAMPMPEAMPAPVPAPVPAPMPAPASVASMASAGAPAAGATYRVVDELNLRAGHGVHTARLAVLPAGSRVVASGARDGDWWEVRARVDGRALTGWTSSLWLRRGEEIGGGPPGA